MHFSLSFVAIAIALSGVVATPFGGGFSGPSIAQFDFSLDNCFNAPIPPWNPGCHPGWYFGNGYPRSDEYPCLRDKNCEYLEQNSGQLQCPPKNSQPSGYYETFSGLTGATQASDYLTYGLVDTVADCEAMCNSVTGCAFVNTYHDVNGKNGSPLLTCSLFSQCHNSSDADNRGGQTQPNGSVDYIIDSAGYCKE